MPHAVPRPSNAGLPSQQPPAIDRVWSLEELAILHELPHPVFIYVSSFTTERPGPLHIFQNTACIKHFGPPRSREEVSKFLRQLPESVIKHRLDFSARLYQEKEIHTARLDIQILQPLFSGVNAGTGVGLAKMDSKIIKICTAPGHVETCIMQVVDLDSTAANDRLLAMHQRSPIHTFMFNSKGSLLQANTAALNAIRRSSGVESFDNTLTFLSIFLDGEYAGGQQEAHAAYQAAYNAIFIERHNVHRHTRSRTKSGRRKWEVLEMWPMTDPEDGYPAVLVKKNNITQQKILEQDLEISQAALQKQNQELENDSAAMQEEKRELQRQANSLVNRLEAVLQDKFQPSSGFDTDTPIDKTLTFLQSIIRGVVPPVQTALDLYNILLASGTDLRLPVGFESQLLADKELDSEVGKSMLQLLKGHAAPRAAKTPLTAEQSKAASLNSTAGSESGALPLFTGLVEKPVLPARSVAAQLSNFVPACITTKVERLLQDSENNWQFDIFSLAEETPGCTLSLLAAHLFAASGVCDDFSIDTCKLLTYLQKIESGYNADNPYHNSTHVASVVQMTHMIMTHGGVLTSGAMTRLQLLASYWSAVVHDYEHQGLNNDFLIKVSDPLAIMYNDMSPLEQHHIAASAALMRDTQYQFVQVMAEDDLTIGKTMREIRSVCINQVLGTDMKKHFDIASRFQMAFKRNQGPSQAAPEPVAWSTVKADDKILVEQMVLKCADIGHLAANLKTHQKWAYQLEEEFFRQGDRERGLQMPVSPLMDRTQIGGMTRSQVGFFNIVGIPLFKAMVEVFEGMQPMLEAVQANCRYWETATATEPAA